MRRMKKRGPNVLFDLNDLLFFLTIFNRFLVEGDSGVWLFRWLVATSSETLERRPSLSVVCRQRPTRKPCCGRETARCHCIKFDTYRNLQRHRAVLPVIARLSCYIAGFHWCKEYGLLDRQEKLENDSDKVK